MSQRYDNGGLQGDIGNIYIRERLVVKKMGVPAMMQGKYLSIIQMRNT